MCVIAVSAVLHMQKRQDAIVEKAKVAMRHLEGEVAKAERESAAKQNEGAQLQDELRAKQQAAAAAKNAHDSIELNEAHLAELETQVQRERSAVQRLKQQRHGQSRSIQHYMDDSIMPNANIDRSKVHGVLARLVRIKDSRHALALEVAAGRKLADLVVADDTIGELAALCCRL